MDTPNAPLRIVSLPPITTEDSQGPNLKWQKGYSSLICLEEMSETSERLESGGVQPVPPCMDLEFRGWTAVGNGEFPKGRGLKKGI